MATYTLISSNVLTSSAASVTFSAIPATYTDLVLRLSVRSAAGATNTVMQMLLNNDSDPTGYYSRTELRGDGATAASSRDSNDNKMQFRFTNASTSTSNTFSNVEIYIPSYLASQNKPLSGINAMETNATTAYLTAQAGLWRKTNAINRIDFSFPDTSNFVSGSSFYLYGISNA
jgi:hypothetical protein